MKVALKDSLFLISLCGFLSMWGCASSPSHSEPVFSNAHIHLLRLHPGQDPKRSLESFVAEHHLKAAVVVSVAGSLTTAALRYANQDKITLLQGHFEIVSLGGVLGSDSGTHLHMSVSDSHGKTWGGHLAEGGKVYTTIEIAIAEVADLRLSRDLDAETGYKELMVHEN